jgi:hypothetical protein
MEDSARNITSKTEAFIHYKNIKAIVRKQLKTQFTNWKRLDRQAKAGHCQEGQEEVVATYYSREIITASKEELLGTEQQASLKGIINLQEVVRFIHRQVQLRQHRAPLRPSAISPVSQGRGAWVC